MQLFSHACWSAFLELFGYFYAFSLPIIVVAGYLQQRERQLPQDSFALLYTKFLLYNCPIPAHSFSPLALRTFVFICFEPFFIFWLYFP